MHSTPCYEETALGDCDSTSHPFMCITCRYLTRAEGVLGKHWRRRRRRTGGILGGRVDVSPQQQSHRLGREPQLTSHGPQKASTAILQGSSWGARSHPFFFFTPGGDLFTSRGGMVTGQGRVARTTAAFVAPARQILEDITCLA